jgi:hypothetical protein
MEGSYKTNSPMKVKLKLTPSQFTFLVQLVENKICNEPTPTNPVILKDNLQLFNARCFLHYGYKKILDLRQMQQIPVKHKTFSIDVNQYVAVCFLLTNLRDKGQLDSYYIALHETLKAQTKYSN